MGGFFFYAVVTLLSLIVGEKILFRQLMLGFIITAVVVVGIRLVYFKPRPVKQQYHNLIEKIDASSFPSWHLARALYLALILGKVMGNLVVPIFIALLVGYSRLYLKKHDWIDLIGGMVLAGVTYLIVILF